MARKHPHDDAPANPADQFTADLDRADDSPIDDLQDADSVDSDGAHFDDDEVDEAAATDDEQQVADDPVCEQTSSEYLGRWTRLISTTNWEKGKIICAWREAMSTAGAPVYAYTDEAWSKRVGNVSPQHVGRLRRVFEQFHEVRDSYDGLYWSHFQAALEWPDPELWLEGAVQNKWSVAEMRRQRWDALGGPPDLKPGDGDIIQAELDEDVDPEHDAAESDTLTGRVAEVRPAESERDDEAAGDDDAQHEADDVPFDTEDRQSAVAALAEPIDPVRPFENLPELPPDLNEAFEAFKLAILHHRLSAWQEADAGDVLRVLEALKQFVLQPTES